MDAFVKKAVLGEVSFQSINIPNEWGLSKTLGETTLLFLVSNQLISPTSGDFPHQPDNK